MTDYTTAEKVDLLERERDARIAELERQLAKADRTLAQIVAWTHEHGAALCPPGADTYGEGMRDAKAQVASMLRQLEVSPSPTTGSLRVLEAARPVGPAHAVPPEPPVRGPDLVAVPERSVDVVRAVRGLSLTVSALFGIVGSCFPVGSSGALLSSAWLRYLGEEVAPLLAASTPASQRAPICTSCGDPVFLHAPTTTCQSCGAPRS
jgi:hypothetical protein